MLLDTIPRWENLGIPEYQPQEGQIALQEGKKKIICGKEGVFRFPPTLTQIFTSLAGDQGFGTRKMSSEHVATFGIKLIGHCAHVQSLKNILESLGAMSNS